MSKETRRPSGRRTYDLRRIRRTVTYSVQQIVELLGVHSNTVHAWFKRGLNRIDASPPYLVHGADLYAFLKVERFRRKRPCGPAEMFCFSCRATRRAVSDSVSIDCANASKASISGQCATCGTRMHRAGSAAKMREYEREFGLSSVAIERIEGPTSPLDKCEKRTEAQHG